MDFTFSENDPLMRVGHGFLCNSFDFTDDELLIQQKRLYKSQSREVRSRYRDSYRIFMRILKRMRFQLAKRCSTLESLSEMESTAERELSRKATNA